LMFKMDLAIEVKQCLSQKKPVHTFTATLCS
jgi:hypothetical protein